MRKKRVERDQNREIISINWTGRKRCPSMNKYPYRKQPDFGTQTSSHGDQEPEIPERWVQGDELGGLQAVVEQVRL